MCTCALRRSSQPFQLALALLTDLPLEMKHVVVAKIVGAQLSATWAFGPDPLKWEAYGPCSNDFGFDFCSCSLSSSYRILHLIWEALFQGEPDKDICYKLCAWHSYDCHNQGITNRHLFFFRKELAAQS